MYLELIATYSDESAQLASSENELFTQARKTFKKSGFSIYFKIREISVSNFEGRRS